MKVRSCVTALAAATCMTAPALMGTPASAARCVSGEEVRGQVATFVHSLRDDVTSPDARAAVRGAFVEAARAARGVKAETPGERRGLGAEISALATQLRDAPGPVERKALIAQIHALQEQKRQDRVGPGDVEDLEADVRAVQRALAAKVDTRREGQQVAAFVHGLMAQFDC